MRQAAILCAGLRDDSRTKMRLAGMAVDQATLLQAAMVDQLSMMVWMQTADGAKGRNRPKSVMQALTSSPQKKDEIRVFASGKDFEKEWKRLTGGD